MANGQPRDSTPGNGGIMAVSVPLESMSVEEKIQVMEIIWDDLCHNADSMESPSWHEDVLREREEALQLGVDEFIDWDVAKKNIRKKLVLGSGRKVYATDLHRQTLT